MRHPRLWPLGVFPAGLTLVFFIGAGFLYFWGVGELVDTVRAIPAPAEVVPASEGFWSTWFGAFLVDAWAWIRSASHWTITHIPGFLFYILFGVVFGLAMWFSFVMIVNIIAAPWNDLLSGRVEEIVYGRAPADEGSILEKFRDLATGAGHSLVRLLLFLLVQIPVFIITLVTGGVGTIVWLVVGVPWGGYFAALEFADVPQSRRKYPLKQKMGIVWRNRAPMLGFGIATYLALFIPLVNLFVIPAAVTGMTLMYLEEVKHEEVVPA